MLIAEIIRLITFKKIKKLYNDLTRGWLSLAEGRAPSPGGKSLISSVTTDHKSTTSHGKGKPAMAGATVTVQRKTAVTWTVRCKMIA